MSQEENGHRVAIAIAQRDLSPEFPESLTSHNLYYTPFIFRAACPLPCFFLCASFALFLGWSSGRILLFTPVIYIVITLTVICFFITFVPIFLLISSRIFCRFFCLLHMIPSSLLYYCTTATSLRKESLFFRGKRRRSRRLSQLVRFLITKAPSTRPVCSSPVVPLFHFSMWNVQGQNGWAVAHPEHFSLIAWWCCRRLIHFCHMMLRLCQQYNCGVIQWEKRLATLVIVMFCLKVMVMPHILSIQTFFSKSSGKHLEM